MCRSFGARPRRSRAFLGMSEAVKIAQPRAWRPNRRRSFDRGTGPSSQPSHQDQDMRKALLVTALLGSALAQPAAAQELRIGFLNTMTGGGAVIGKHMENGWKLGLEHQGWKKDGDPLGGVPTRVFYGDDQSKTDVGLREVERMIKGE